MFESILFTHGNIEMRNIVYEALTNLGYQVTNALAYKDISEILKKSRPDYIVMDKAVLDTPVEAVLARIKTIDQKIKVIFLEPEENTPQAIIGKIVKILNENRLPAEAAAAALNPKKEAGIKFKANILAVDNEKECADLIKIFLSKKGFNVDTAISGEEALFKINTTKPDIVLLDINMYGVDGLMALKTIKGIDESIIVIMTSSLEEDKIIQEALKLGANGYLIKPFNFEELEKIIVESAMKKA